MEAGTPIFCMVRLDSITYLTGVLVEPPGDEIVITRVTWHRATGRHHQWVAGTGDSTEREAYPADMVVRLRREDVPLLAGPWNGKIDGGSL